MILLIPMAHHRIVPFVVVFQLPQLSLSRLVMIVMMMVCRGGGDCTSPVDGYFTTTINIHTEQVESPPMRMTNHFNHSTPETKLGFPPLLNAGPHIPFPPSSPIYPTVIDKSTQCWQKCFNLRDQICNIRPNFALPVVIQQAQVG